MTGRERILAAFHHESTDCTPWVPFAGVHAGKLAGHSARRVLTDRDALVESLAAVNALYKPDGQPVLFDLQIEAEILGCRLVWAEHAPPSVASHPLADTKLVPSKIPARADGRLPLALGAMERMKRGFGESTALYGLLCGPFTLASHLRGTELLMDMILDPPAVHALLDYCAEVARAVAGYYVEAEMDVIAVVDPMVSQISPAHFDEFLASPFSQLFASIRSSGALSSFFVCGNATANIAPMCATRPDSISVDENVSLSAAKRITDRAGILIGGNLPLTSVMLLGSQQDNLKSVMDLFDSLRGPLDAAESPRAAGGADAPIPNLIVSPGCDMPYDTPIENVTAVEHAVHRTAQVREMIRTYESAPPEFHGALPDYAHLPRPLVEVFTLDSATCAACAYMLASAMDAKARFGNAIDVVEYRATSRENIARARAMNVTHLPSIYIDGALSFSSIIPNREELYREIALRLK